MGQYGPWVWCGDRKPMDGEVVETEDVFGDPRDLLWLAGCWRFPKSKDALEHPARDGPYRWRRTAVFGE